MSIKVIYFDLGGVLLRTEDSVPRTNLAARFGLTSGEMEKLVFYSSTGKLATIGKITSRQHWEAICEALKVPPDNIENLQSAFFGGDRLDQDLLDTLRSLRPKYRTVLLSNAWNDVRSWLEESDATEGVFDEMIISAEVGLAKPDPRIYWLALERLQVQPSETVFVDDFIDNVNAARSLGMNAIHFQESTQTKAELFRLLNHPL